MVDTRVSQRLRGCRDDVADLQERLGALLDAPTWDGPDAERFRSACRAAHLPALEELHAALAALT